MIIWEREARTFAAELLMPLPEVRKRWLVEQGARFGLLGEAPREELIRRVAEELAVTSAAMRIQLTELRLIPR